MTGLVAFLFLSVIVCLIPFIPAFLEMCFNSDVKPAEIRQKQAVDPRSDPQQVFWYQVGRLGLPSLEQLEKFLRASGTRMHPSGTLLLEPGAELGAQVKSSHVLSYGPIRVSPRARYASKIVSLTSVEAARTNQFLEVHARDDLELGRGSKVFWWASAARVSAAVGCTLIGKICGRERVRIADGTRFHLVQSPRIEIGDPDEASDEEEIPTPAATGRLLCMGDLEIPKGAKITQHLVVRGRLVVGEGASILGSIKAYKGVEIRKNARVSGAVFCEGSIDLAQGCRILGPLGSEARIQIQNNVAVGHPERLTSVVAQELLILGNCRIHGTARAWKAGEVRIRRLGWLQDMGLGAFMASATRRPRAAGIRPGEA